MATFKTCNKKGKYHDLSARDTVLRYINNPAKALSNFRGGVGVTENIAESMEIVAQQFNKTFNSISYLDGHRYYGTKKEYYNLVNFIKHFLYQEYGLYLVTVSALSEVDIQGEAIN